MEHIPLARVYLVQLLADLTSSRPPPKANIIENQVK